MRDYRVITVVDDELRPLAYFVMDLSSVPNWRPVAWWRTSEQAHRHQRALRASG
jgi:hypothetical protein